MTVGCRADSGPDSSPATGRLTRPIPPRTAERRRAASAAVGPSAWPGALPNPQVEQPDVHCARLPARDRREPDAGERLRPEIELIDFLESPRSARDPIGNERLADPLEPQPADRVGGRLDLRIEGGLTVRNRPGMVPKHDIGVVRPLYAADRRRLRGRRGITKRLHKAGEWRIPGRWMPAPGLGDVSIRARRSDADPGGRPIGVQDVDRGRDLKVTRDCDRRLKPDAAPRMDVRCGQRDPARPPAQL